ncbi:hypothetical protein SUGI_0891330 [Cryptomeria japonica]|nr:hypothetical protein SUGI_0891330 [Cryptomeria japonica]
MLSSPLKCRSGFLKWVRCKIIAIRTLPNCYKKCDSLMLLLILVGLQYRISPRDFSNNIGQRSIHNTSLKTSKAVLGVIPPLLNSKSEGPLHCLMKPQGFL